MTNQPPQQVVDYAITLHGKYPSTWGVEVLEISPSIFAITVFSSNGEHIDHCELMEA